MSANETGERGRTALAILGVLGVAAAFFLADRVLGEIAVPLFGAVLLAAVVVQRPKLALGLVLVAAIMVEDNSEGGLFPGLAGLYEGAPLSPFEALLGLSVAATGLDVARRKEVRLPEPLTLPLLLMLAAIASGAVVGVSGGATPKEVGFDLRPLLALFVLPFVVVNCIRTREELIGALKVGVALVAVKSALGIVSVAIGRGYPNPPDPSITYLSPSFNFVAMAFLMIAAVAIWRQRSRPSIWLLAVSALALTSLLLSYRRSFWIATIAALLIVVLVGAGPLRWRVALPGVAVLVAALWLTLNSNVVGDVSGPIATRAASIAPTKIEANAQDRYRTGERKNVLADLRANPVTGLGVAVPWTGRYPPSLDRPGSRDYVHFTALWWWLKLGLIGLISYLWLVAASSWAAYRVWRDAADPWLRALGLGLLGGLVGLALAETTGAFTGVTTRFSVTIAVVLGLLAVARWLVSSDEESRPLEPEWSTTG